MLYVIQETKRNKEKIKKKQYKKKTTYACNRYINNQKDGESGR